ncbi:hypothetical protein SUGI_0228910 [Cryptomeria japonica]|nr:hypothetical protein SUGI_0228910 [Cryptomeria japonica]
MQVRQQFREIFLEMGFEEMPTNNFVESSWHPKVEETINEFARHGNKEQVSIGCRVQMQEDSSRNVIKCMQQQILKDAFPAYNDRNLTLRNSAHKMHAAANIVGAEEVTHLEEAALFKTFDKGNVIVLDTFQAKGLSMSESNRITNMQSWLDVLCDNKRLDQI